MVNVLVLFNKKNDEHLLHFSGSVYLKTISIPVFQTENSRRHFIFLFAMSGDEPDT